MPKNHLAHIATIQGQRTEQTVKEHSFNTAKYAADKLKGIGLYHTAYLAGMIHDMGKTSDKFEQYLEKAFRGEDVARGSVNHTFAATVYLFEKFHLGKPKSFDTLTCEILSFATGSHHGLFDCVDTESKNGFEHRTAKNRSELCYKEVKENFFAQCISEVELEQLFESATNEIRVLCKKIYDDCERKKSSVTFLLGMIARMVLSAVIEGDRRDTAEFMSGIQTVEPKATEEGWQKQLAYLEDKIAKFDRDTPINQARGAISDQCKLFANREGGVYKITVPTGAGKTLSALRYALAHAEKYKKDRIIFIIPLLSVLEQNSKVIRGYIADPELVSEHHSNVVRPAQQKDCLDEYELLSETWDSAVIISTLVQLLNVLFSDKTQIVRRMSSLANSVIVIDEVQSLPRNMTDMFNMAVRFLARYCNATIVLSSATQPCFEKANMPLPLSESPEMVPYREDVFRVFKRTRVIDKTDPYGMTIEELGDFSRQIMRESSSLLIICNTKSEALNLYRLLSEEAYSVFHLSTAMCMQHRIDILEKIQDCLNKRQKTVCISTQLVEAGVDISFECVIRINAGMDNIAQAAGRCNRNNDFKQICPVYVVKLRNEKLNLLKDIKVSQSCTTRLFYQYAQNADPFQNDLLSESSISQYYRLLFADPGIKELFKYPYENAFGQTDYLFDLLSHNEKYTQREHFAERYFLNQAFKTAGHLFKVFEENTVDIIVPYNEEAKEIIGNLCSEKANFDYIYLKEQVEKAKKYTIHIFEYQKKKLEEYGMLFSDEGGHFIALNEQCYNKKIGLDIENEFLSEEGFYEAR